MFAAAPIAIEETENPADMEIDFVQPSLEGLGVVKFGGFTGPLLAGAAAAYFSPILMKEVNTVERRLLVGAAVALVGSWLWNR